MLSDLNIATIVSCLGFTSVAFAILALRSTILRQDQLLSEALSQIREFVLASLAYKASAEVHPMTGPAVLQQLGKISNKPQPVAENKPGPEKTGITVRQGMSKG